METTLPQKNYFDQLRIKAGKKIYKMLWLIFRRFFSAPTFIIIHGIHYVMIKNILPYLRSYRIYPATSWAKKYLIENRLPFSKHLFFPKVIVEANFNFASPLLSQCTFSYQAAIEIQMLKKIQIYHGVVDKNWTYSPHNKWYDLLLVSGHYAEGRLQKIGIAKSKIKVVGFPKLDTYYKSNRKKETSIIPKLPTIVYAPTWGTITSLPFMLRELIKLHKRYRLIVKPHYYTYWHYIDFLKDFGITLWENEDIIPLFDKADILISDSSSAMFEFLITGKPVIAIDVATWLYGKVLTNAKRGPEIALRNLFYRVKDVNKIDSLIKELIKKRRFKQNLITKAVTQNLFEPIFPAGKKAAEEIEKFINK